MAKVGLDDINRNIQYPCAKKMLRHFAHKVNRTLERYKTGG